MYLDDYVKLRKPHLLPGARPRAAAPASGNTHSSAHGSATHAHSGGAHSSVHSSGAHRSSGGSTARSTVPVPATSGANAAAVVPSAAPVPPPPPPQFRVPAPPAHN